MLALECEKIEIFFKSCSTVKRLRDIYKFVGTFKTFEDLVTETESLIKYKNMFQESEKR